MNRFKTSIRKVNWIFSLNIFLFLNSGFAQTTTPTVITDQYLGSLTGSSGNASLYNGVAGFSIPIYSVQCGSLTLPISLDYSIME